MEPIIIPFQTKRSLHGILGSARPGEGEITALKRRRVAGTFVPV